MKAKHLAELLLQNPEAEVILFSYTGALTESVAISKVRRIRSGKFCNSDGGDHLDKAGFAKTDITALS